MCLQLYYIICSIILSIPLFMRFSGMGLKRSERPVLTGGLRFLTEIHQHPLLTIFCPLYQVPIWKESAKRQCGRGPAAALPRLLLAAKPAKSCQRTIGPPPATLPAGRAAPSRLRRSLATAPRPGVAASRTVRGCLAPPGGGLRAPSAQMALVQPCQSAGVFRCCGSGSSPDGQVGNAPGIGKGLQHFIICSPFCVTLMQGLEVVSP